MTQSRGLYLEMMLYKQATTMWTSTELHSGLTFLGSLTSAL
jgi:hypothetical protein